MRVSGLLPTLHWSLNTIFEDSEDTWCSCSPLGMPHNFDWLLPDFGSLLDRTSAILILWMRHATFTKRYGSGIDLFVVPYGNLLILLRCSWVTCAFDWRRNLWRSTRLEIVLHCRLLCHILLLIPFHFNIRFLSQFTILSSRFFDNFSAHLFFVIGEFIGWSLVLILFDWIWFDLLGLWIQRLCWSGLRGQWLHGELVLVYFISGTVEDKIVFCGCIEEESREGLLDSILLLGSCLSNSLRAQSLPSVYLTQWLIACSSLWYLAFLVVPFTRRYECRRWPEPSSKFCTCESRSSVWRIVESDWMRNVSRGTIPGFGFEHLWVICQHV